MHYTQSQLPPPIPQIHPHTHPYLSVKSDSIIAESSYPPEKSYFVTQDGSIMDYLYQFHRGDQFDMLFTSFAEEPSCSPLSTLESLPPHDLSSPNHTPFRLTGGLPRSTLLRRPQEVEKDILEWLAVRGVECGHPELLREQFNGLQVRRVISAQEGPSRPPPGFLERRLSRKLTIKL